VGATCGVTVRHFSLLRVTLMVEAPKLVFVTETVRVPDPVYERLEQEADRQDVPRGVIVKEWMEKAEQYEQIKKR